ncbi:MAG: CAP domain-containing protein, partial [Nitrosopumilus sp.]|nr:CAP domain-containing protein [Nitrosopumilus sp.]
MSITKLYDLTNQEREKAGLQPLTYNDKLAQAAQQKANDMFAKNYWAHYGPNNENPWQFILGAGYDYEYAGENLAKNFLFSKGVVDAWMNSPTHKENMVRKEYTDIGFAVVNGMLNGEETTLVVQMFGTPQSGIAQVPAKKPETVEKPVVNVQEEIVVNTKPAVLAKNDSKSTIPLVPILFNFNVIFFVFLFVALALDFYFASKLKLIR